MPEQNGDKTQDPTPHRRQQAREEGQIAQSQDLASSIILVAALAWLLMAGSALVEFFGSYARRQLGGDAWLRIDAGFLSEHTQQLLVELGKGILPLFGTIILAGVLSHVGQFGFLFVPERLLPDFSRVNPLEGFRRLISLPSLVRLGFGIIKIVIVGGVAFWNLYSRRDEILGVAALDLPQIAAMLADVVLWTSLKIAGALLILSLFDFLFQWWQHEQSLRMTQQEVREEMRNLQGDPQVAARRRAVQRQLVLQRLQQAVPKADVVVTNPTELAIAIQYEPDSMAAPVVLAKGAGHMAARIRRLALESGVPIVERKPLAQALYKQVEINRPIPDTLYGAVAEVLAYVYQLKGKTLPKQAG